MNIRKADNHYYVFVDLATKNNNGETQILAEPSCYILHSSDVDEIAFHWEAKTSDATGYGFEAKYLWYLKYQNMQSITENNIKNFKIRQNISGEIDFEKYKQIILSLSDFEKKYHKLK